MSTKARRLREKENRKQSIIDAAEILFREKGIDCTSVNQIANKAEVAKGTVYLYFRDKNDLILTLSLKALNTLYNYIVNRIKDQKTGLDKVMTHYTSIYTFYSQNPYYYRLAQCWNMINTKHLIQSDSINVKEILDNKNKYFNLLEGAFQLGFADKSIRKINSPREYILTTEAALIGLLDLCIARKELLELKYDTSINIMIDTFLELIKRDLTK